MLSEWDKIMFKIFKISEYQLNDCNLTHSLKNVVVNFRERLLNLVHIPGVIRINYNNIEGIQLEFTE